MAYIRKPNPKNYFLDSVTPNLSCDDIQISMSDSVHTNIYFIDSSLEVSDAYCAPTERDSNVNINNLSQPGKHCSDSSDYTYVLDHNKICLISEPKLDTECTNTKRPRKKPLRFRDPFHCNLESVFSSLTPYLSRTMDYIV